VLCVGAGSAGFDFGYRLGSGQTGLQSARGTAADLTGVNQIVIGLYGYDINGNRVSKSPEASGEALGEGATQLGVMVVGSFAKNDPQVQNYVRGIFLKLKSGTTINVSSAGQVSTARTFLSVQEFASLPQTGTIDPSLIRFSQDSISPTFRGGGSVEDLTAQLGVGVDSSTVPPIRIVPKEGQVYTLDNRRLKAFQDAGVPIPYERLQSIPKRELFKFTTQNEGVHIVIRERSQ
jgi:hypothetical protein